MKSIIIQLVSLQIKHFICDYPLQNKYMLGKFKKYPDFIMPLVYHCAIQAIGTMILCVIFSWPSWFIVLDFISHFIIDRIKASPNLGGRWKADNPCFWWALGADQMAHHIIGIVMIWWII